MSKVTINSKQIDFDAVVNLMDDEIREDLHSTLDAPSEQSFVDAYIKRHAEKFDGEKFDIA